MQASALPPDAQLPTAQPATYRSTAEKEATHRHSRSVLSLACTQTLFTGQSGSAYQWADHDL